MNRGKFGYVVLAVGVVITFYIMGAKLTSATNAVAANRRTIGRLTALERKQAASNVESHHLSCGDQQDTWDVASKFIDFETDPGVERRELQLILGPRPTWDGTLCVTK